MQTQTVTDGLIAMLRAQTDNAGNALRIGDAEAPLPPDGKNAPRVPYAVLYERNGTWSGPPLSDEFAADGDLIYQVTNVSWSRRSAEWMADRVRTAILGRTSGTYTNDIVIDGYLIIDRSLENLGRTTIEGTLWNVIDDYRLITTPHLIVPDTEDPSTPLTLMVISYTMNSIELGWEPSTDDVGVVGYHIYRDGSSTPYEPTPVTLPTFTDFGVGPGETHTYRVAAYDAAGNVSAPSNSVTATSASDTTPPSQPGGLIVTLLP